MWLWRDTAQSHCPRPGSSWPGWSRTRTLPTWGSFTVQLGTTSRTGSPEKVTPYSVLPNWSVLIEGCVFVFMVYSVFTVYVGSFVYLSVDQPHGEPHVSLPNGVGGIAPVLLHTGAPRHGGAGGQWPQTGNLLLLQHPGQCPPHSSVWCRAVYCKCRMMQKMLAKLSNTLENMYNDKQNINAGYSIEYCIYSWSLKFRIYRCWFFFLQFFVQNKRTLVSFIELPALVSTLCLTIIVGIWACCSLCSVVWVGWLRLIFTCTGGFTWRGHDCRPDHGPHCVQGLTEGPDGEVRLGVLHVVCTTLVSGGILRQK